MAGNGKNSPVGMPERFGPAEAKRGDWVIDIELGTEAEELLQPSYWAHLAPQLSPFDTIEARAEDGSWIAYLRVIFAERNYARVAMEREIFRIAENAAIPQSASLKYKVDWKGPHHRFAVLRLADSAMLKSQFKTREEATSWMVEHEKGTRT